MSLKKTDMVKNLAKKLDGQRKAAGVPQRFGQGSSAVAAKSAKPAGTEDKVKLVQLSCRLPAPLAAQLRDRATAHEGGVNTIVAEALAQWLEQKKPAGS